MNACNMEYDRMGNRHKVCEIDNEENNKFMYVYVIELKKLCKHTTNR